MNLPNRKVEFKKATQGRVPLIIGLSGASNSGKTYSALRLATGIQSVVGGKIYGIDTESGRMRHYAKYFNFDWYGFDAPFSPLDYVVCINKAVESRAKIIVIDSMSHEHESEGGVLDQIETFLDQKCGDNYEKRQALNMLAQVKPKTQRKVLNRRIVGLGDIIFILCYRAAEKIKPRKKGAKVPEGEDKMLDLGWQPITTSSLPYDMTARFLLTPGCEGKPTMNPDTKAEKMMVKTAKQFEGWFKDGFQIDEALGVKFAKWATEGEGTTAAAPAALPPAQVPTQTPAPQAASKTATPTSTKATPPPDGLSDLSKDYEKKLRAAGNMAELSKAFADVNENKDFFTSAERIYLGAVKDECKEKLGSLL